jgi:membrane-bound lytic murein transglycosylase B
MIEQRFLSRRAFFPVLTGAVCLPFGAQAQGARPFPQWVESFRPRATARGISDETYTRVMGNLKPDTTVFAAINNQPEFKEKIWQYLNRRVSDWRIQTGKEKLKQHGALLTRIEKDVGVSRTVLLALWGIESAYGDPLVQQNHMRPVFPALAALAWGEPRRRAYWEKELLNALTIVERGWSTPAEMRGSWAGAMGQSQFMPSSYHAYAIDYDRDGQRDIWTSLPDVFASIANYLARAGWNDDYTWGRQVRLPARLSSELIGLDASRPLPEWQRLGVRRADGGDLPAVPIKAALLSTDDGQGPAYLVYDNFRVLMAWNRSTYFALTVGELADLIARP